MQGLRLGKLAALIGVAGCALVVPYDRDALTAGIFLGERLPRAAPVNLRPVSSAGLELTKSSEGFRARLYNDASRYCTIGYGHLIYKRACDGNEPAEFLAGIAEPRGSRLLISDMEIAEQAVTELVTRELTQGQYDALCDFVFNIGVGNFGRSTLLLELNAGDFGDVAVQFRRWVLSKGVMLEGLRVRREREIALFFGGAAPPRPRIEKAVPAIDIETGLPGAILVR